MLRQSGIPAPVWRCHGESESGGCARAGPKLPRDNRASHSGETIVLWSVLPLAVTGLLAAGGGWCKAVAGADMTRGKTPSGK